jgi:hypothetical protein
MRKTFVLFACALPALLACEGFGQAVSSHTDVLARAAGHDLTVDKAAALVAPHRDVPAQREVVDAIANLWVDYVLLATAASRDSTLQNVELAPLLKPYRDQMVVLQLRDRVIHPDTQMTDAQLRAQYEKEEAGLEVRARHILLRLPPDATPAVRDSVTKLAQQLRDRARGGEDFATLARAFSADGSAQQGGDLGFTGRNGWVAPFEQAAFALKPGEISDVVETPFGLHIIKVEERRQPAFDSVRVNFRQEALRQRQMSAESLYVTGLTDTLHIAVQEGAAENAREIGRSPGSELRGRAGSRPLVRYQGGAFSAAEFLEVAQSWDPRMRGQLVAASDEQIRLLLEGVTRNKILVDEAERLKLTVSDAQLDSVRASLRAQLLNAAVSSGLTGIQPQDGETMHQAIERRVQALLESILKGEASAFPLGPISYGLRRQFSGEVFERAFDQVVARIEAQRPAQPTAPTVPPDTGR